jgi:hypothetical protein
MTSSTESFSYAYNLSVEAQYSYSQMQGTNISFNAGFNSKDQGGQSGSSGGASGSFSGAGTIKGSTTNTVTNTNTQTMSVSYQYSNTVNFATAVTFTAQLSDVNPSTKTMGVTGPSSKSPTVLPVASTEYFSANGQIIINPNTSTSEVATIASIQAGTSFTLSNPLQQTHQNGEPVWPAWPYMDVFQFQDLILGGIAFQNPRATPSFASPYLIWQNDANGAWNWYGQLPNASSPVTFSQVATGVGTGNLQVIGLGLDGLPYLIWQNNANGTWNWSGALPNASSPVTFSQIATGVGNGGNLQVFGLGANDGLPYLIWQNNANGAWNWYGQLPNASSPVKFFQVATGVGTGNLQVVGLGANDGLPYLIWQNNANGTWNWYGVLPNSSFAFRRIATAVGNGGNLQVIALGL